MKAVTQKETKERLSKAKPRLPSPSLVSAYMESFQSFTTSLADDTQDIATEPESGSSGDDWLRYAEACLRAKKYDQADKAYDQALALGTTLDLSRAYLMRGTFRFLKGQSVTALEDFERVHEIDPQNSESWVKQAGLLVEGGEIERGLLMFQKAIEVDSSNADAFYHRGQVYFLMDKNDEAIEEYQRAIALNPTLPLAHIQLAVAQYRLGKTASAMAAFRRAVREFPSFAPARIYYAEMLIDAQQFDEADRLLKEASNLDPSNALIYTNRASLTMAWKNDLNAAEEHLKAALKVDPSCDAAVAQLAQLEIHRQNFTSALSYFEQAASLARTEAELSQVLAYIEVFAPSLYNNFTF